MLLNKKLIKLLKKNLSTFFSLFWGKHNMLVEIVVQGMLLIECKFIYLVSTHWSS